MVAVVEPHLHEIGIDHWLRGHGLLGSCGLLAGGRRFLGSRSGKHHVGNRLRGVAGQAEPESPIVAPQQHATNGYFALGVRRGEPHLRDEPQVLHIDGQLFGGRPIRFTLPERLGIAVDGHQRTVLDGGVTGLGTRRQFARGGGAFEDTGVWRGFLERDLHLVSALGGQLDHHLVKLVTKVAVLVLDPEIDRVARLDLVRRSLLRHPLVSFLALPRLTLQAFAECLLLGIDDQATGNRKLPVGGNDDVDVRKRDLLEFLLERVGIITPDLVLSGDLELPVALLDGPQFGRQVHAEQPLAGPATDQEHLFVIPTGFGGHDHRNPVVTPADSQVAVLDNDRERQSRRVRSLAVPSQSANGSQQVQLVDVAFFVAVDFRETVQRLVGQRDRRHAIQHAPKDHPGLVTITPAMRQHTSQEFSPNHHVEFTTVGELLENQLRLVIDLLSQERLADSKFGLDRLGRLGVPVLDRGEFVPGQVEPL